MNPSLRFRLGLLFCTGILLGSLLTLCWPAYHQVVSPFQPGSNPREGWAVLMEMNFYESGTDLATGYADTQKWNTTLHTLGWQTDHILLHRGPIVQQTGEAALQFLSTNADANDVVLFFVFAHGNYLLTDVQWQAWFPHLWTELLSQEKLFMVSACSSEIMLQPLYDDPAPHIHLASTEDDEFAWAGLPEEGLPVIGEVFNHFFTNALVNASADSNTDGEVTIEEAFSFAAPLSRTYISSVVFPAFPDFETLCSGVAPQPIMDDAYLNDFSLQVESGEPPLLHTGIPVELVYVLGAMIVITVVLAIGLFVRKK